ncbi:uncharacterized protein B0T23DRAFT_401348 [Neurospora hispaniola]|uniref:Uncharacterized protein n=1 Tax=Neurospora hispaniola TaxID=588809 RepID=A0AAJ0IGD4_9PEZI|nr:hypothetical protein B0T23DRAFT_401348 [Neurospora hispaniola]
MGSRPKPQLKEEAVRRGPRLVPESPNHEGYRPVVSQQRPYDGAAFNFAQGFGSRPAMMPSKTPASPRTSPSQQTQKTMASLDGSPVAPFMPGGAEVPRISLENPTTTLFESQVEILLWPGDGNQMDLTLGLSVDLLRLSRNTASRQQLKRQDAVTDDSVPTFTSALVVTLEVPTLEDLRCVLATSVLVEVTVLTDQQKGNGTVPSTSTYPTDDQGLLPARFSPQRGINPPRALAASLPRSATLLAGPLASPVPLVPSLLAHSNSPMYPIFHL